MEHFSHLESSFFEQGEDKKAMRKTPDERVEDLNIAERERETGHLEREFFARSEIVNMKNTFDAEGNLDSIQLAPEVKVAFLHDVARQLEAKQAALKALDPAPLDEIRSVAKEIERVEDLQVKYGLEVDLGEEEQAA
ncbi:MAG: hypothetical protein UY95_C0015G0006 [Parcubacteria group bacterium GW2011_GWA2_56_7]|nr:MAG: hypothetical protein UY95_C0015G0006 [Parcubacteria group bacterium GW2011_GWA2_56_7]